MSKRQNQISLVSGESELQNSRAVAKISSCCLHAISRRRIRQLARIQVLLVLVPFLARGHVPGSTVTGFVVLSLINWVLSKHFSEFNEWLVGYTRGRLHERVDGHKQKLLLICKHYLSEHNSEVPHFLSEQFHVLTKGSNKFDCLIKEILFIRKLKPSLNVQADSIYAKVFT